MKDNKLIAEFMGGQKVLSDKDIYNMPTHDNLCYQLKELQYHQSWDWLMPVIEKCFDNSEDGDMQDIMHHLMVVDFDNTYDAVVEFLKRLTDET